MLRRKDVYRMAKVIVCLADGFEEVEGLMVVDLVRRVGIDLDMVSVTGNYEVTSSHDVTVKADLLFEEADFEHADMIVLPGGMPGTRNLQAHEGLQKQLLKFFQEGKMLGAICAGPTVLGCNHILEGKNACCYPGFEEELLGAKVNEKAVNVDGTIITSRGLGTALEFASAIVAHFKGEETAQELKQKIVWNCSK